ncbi:type VII secretion integral membrane protein EccD [Streptomyces sp. LBL]|uniref:type VII secretion integral membrane protein EccD n=1 Tax=Streptomyces sp. LBL TaxID=2940562 RepID=UPI0024733E12|nr:type VII secretion integral membrane protein EccD [Streptomyces sp. LBL]MDH6630472.1 type VII secretion integral membrane protein EccD [Streptomyces sp. LBL]
MTTAVPASRTPRAVSTEVCRLTIAGPAGRADLAVPVTTPVSALMPVLLRHVPTDPDRAVGSWGLQRLGETPLDLDATPQSAGLHHGDILYLRPADDPISELEFDDVADGVSTAVGSHSDRWRPELTRKLFLALAGFVLAGLASGVAVIASGPFVCILYAISAVVLGVACALDSRVPADRGSLLVTGVGACAFAALAGMTAVHGAAGLQSPAQIDVMLCGGSAVAMSLVLLATRQLPLAVFGTTLLTGALVEITGLLAGAFDWNTLRGTTTTAVVFFLFGHMAPRISLRLARLRIPQLPRNADELQEDIDPQPESLVSRRAATADAILTVLSVVTGLFCSAAFILLARVDGWISWTLSLVLAGAVLLRSKNLNATWQRIPMTFCGTLGLLAVVLSWASASSGGTRFTLLSGLLIGAVLLLVGAWRLPRTRLLPVWGHTADILELLTALALLPLLLQLLHVYSYFRALVS